MRALGQARRRAVGARGAAARRGRACARRRTEAVPVPSSRRAMWCSCVQGDAFPPTASWSRTAAELDECDDHRRIPAGRARRGATVIAGTVAGCVGARPGDRGRGRDTACRDPATGRRGGDFPLADTGARRSRATGLLFYSRRRPLVTLVAGCWCAGRERRRSTRTVTVLVIACPHALGLAIPLVIAICDVAVGAPRHPRPRPAGAGAHARRRRGAVRQDGHADPGRAHVDGIAALDGDDDLLLLLAAAVEAESSTRLRARSRRRQPAGALPAASGFRSLPGRGVEASVDGAEVAVGGPALLRELGIEAPPGSSNAPRDSTSAERRSCTS